MKYELTDSLPLMPVPMQFRFRRRVPEIINEYVQKILFVEKRKKMVDDVDQIYCFRKKNWVIIQFVGTYPPCTISNDRHFLAIVEC